MDVGFLKTTADVLHAVGFARSTQPVSPGTQLGTEVVLGQAYHTRIVLHLPLYTFTVALHVGRQLSTLFPFVLLQVVP